MKKLYRRSISGLLALLICFTAILGSGMTAYAAAFTGETADSYSVAFPRDGDANLDYSGTWGHDELHYMNHRLLRRPGLLLHRARRSPKPVPFLRKLWGGLLGHLPRRI